MKKLIKILSVNIVIIFILFIAADYAIYLKFYNANYKTFPFPSYIENYKNKFSIQSIQAFKHLLYNDYFRTHSLNDNYTKAPILIFGC